MKRIFFGVIVLLFTIIYFLNANHNSLSQPRDTYKLRYKMKNGETFDYSIATELESIQEIMGLEMTTHAQINSKIHIISEGVYEGKNLVFIVTYESIKMHLNSSMMGDTTIQNPPGFLGKRMKKIITPFGDQMRSIDMDSIKAIPFAPQLTSDQELFPGIPESELKMGELVSMTDTDTTKMMNGSTISKSNTEFTLVGKETKLGYGCLKINFKSTITLEGDGITLGMNFFIEGEGNNEGVIYFAPEEGLLVSIESITDLEMTAAVTGQQNMTIPITQTVNSKMILLK